MKKFRNLFITLGLLVLTLSATSCETYFAILMGKTITITCENDSNVPLYYYVQAAGSVDDSFAPVLVAANSSKDIQATGKFFSDEGNYNCTCYLLTQAQKAEYTNSSEKKNYYVIAAASSSSKEIKKCSKDFSLKNDKLLVKYSGSELTITAK